MARAKLSEQEKQEIVRLYRETDASTTRLAEQFSISTSTISRLLRAEIDPEAYALLSANRRGGKSIPEPVQTSLSIDDEATPAEAPLQAPDAVMPIDDSEPEASGSLPVVVPEVPLSEPVVAVAVPDVSEPEPVVAVAVPPVEDTQLEAAPSTDLRAPLVEVVPVPVEAVVEPEVPTDALPVAESTSAQSTDARRRRRRSAPSAPELPLETVAAVIDELPPPIVAPAPEPVLEVVIPTLAEPTVPVSLDEPTAVIEAPVEPVRSRILKKSDPTRTPPPAAPESTRPLPIPAAVPAQFAEIEAELASAPGRFDGEEFDDEDDFEDEEFDDGAVALDEELTGGSESAVPIEVLPFTEAEFPRICWVVVDRASELMTRPLRDFNNIGAIPDTEREEITLPIFENSRIARGYSGHYNRPLRLPAHLIGSTRTYLLRKGITRLLVGKQVYSLALAGEVPGAAIHDDPEE